MGSKYREPAVSGSFYPGRKAELEQFIDRAVKKAEIKQDVSTAKAYVAPHAGYIYSGWTAAYSYKAMSTKDDIAGIETTVVIGPNHTGYGTPISISMEDWATPIGVIQNDKELSKEITKIKGISKDESAHKYEHSVEVQLPFMQHLFPGKKACFICMGDQRMESAELLSGAISKAASTLSRKITVLASSDFNHYESRAIMQRKDNPLFEQLEKMDCKRFYELKENSHESACGYGPIATALLFAKSHDASRGALLHNSDSGDETGDTSSVVDYAAFAFC
jgi:hypothetical protein